MPDLPYTQHASSTLTYGLIHAVFNHLHEDSTDRRGGKKPDRRRLNKCENDKCERPCRVLYARHFHDNQSCQRRLLRLLELFLPMTTLWERYECASISQQCYTQALTSSDAVHVNVSKEYLKVIRYVTSSHPGFSLAPGEMTPTHKGGKFSHQGQEQTNISPNLQTITDLQFERLSAKISRAQSVLWAPPIISNETEIQLHRVTL